MNVMLLIVRLLLAAVFGVAGVAKLLDPAGSRKSAGEFGVPRWLTPAAALLLPLCELACAVALLRSSWAARGATGALGLLVVFMAAIAANMMRGRRPECRCFGHLSSSPAGWTTLSRNAVLAGLAGLVVSHGSRAGGLSVASWLPVLDRPIAVGWVLALVAGEAVVGLLVLYQLLRQNGRALQRLDAIEQKIGMADDQPRHAGLQVEDRAPAFSLTGLDGAAVTLDMLGESGKPILLFFSEPGCGACDTILPDVGRWQRELADRLVIVPVSRGGADENRAKGESYRVRNILRQRDREVADAYRVEGTPSAVLVTDGLIASPLAVGPHAIRSLVSRVATRPPLSKGDLVPSLKLRDLNGGTMDLASTGGRRTLVLFWNPACGFCQSMLEDVKAWELNPPASAPDLLIVSAGSPRVNRDQGFRSRVLLDPAFAAGTVFGAEGTPAALIIEHGRVASEVSVGAPEVLTLAGAVPASASLVTAC